MTARARDASGGATGGATGGAAGGAAKKAAHARPFSQHDGFSVLRHYRDDGPLLEVGGPAVARLPLAAAIGGVLGVVALAAGLGVDGGDTGLGSILGVAAFVLLAGIGAHRDPSVRTSWMGVPLLRAGEYGLLACLAWRAGAGALPAAYGLLAAVAFHHYDIVYRLRHQGAALPAWVGRLGLGWEGRSVVLLLGALAGVTTRVAVALGIWCGLLFVTESVASWVRLTGNDPAPTGDTEGDE